jgi:hypothetical protein
MNNGVARKRGGAGDRHSQVDDDHVLENIWIPFGPTSSILVSFLTLTDCKEKAKFRSGEMFSWFRMTIHI